MTILWLAYVGMSGAIGLLIAVAAGMIGAAFWNAETAREPLGIKGYRVAVIIACGVLGLACYMGQVSMIRKRHRVVAQVTRAAAEQNEKLGDAAPVPLDRPVFIVDRTLRDIRHDPNLKVSPSRRAAWLDAAVLLEVAGEEKLATAIHSLRRYVEVTATLWPEGTPVGKYRVEVQGFGEMKLDGPFWSGEEIAVAKWANEMSSRPRGDGALLGEAEALEQLEILGLRPDASPSRIVFPIGSAGGLIPAIEASTPETRRTESDSVRQLLDETIDHLSRPENDFSWSGWPDAEAARKEVLATLNEVSLATAEGRHKARVLFAPTGPIQEVSISSGWGEQFLELARKADRLFSADATPSGPGAK